MNIKKKNDAIIYFYFETNNIIPVILMKINIFLYIDIYCNIIKVELNIYCFDY